MTVTSTGTPKYFWAINRKQEDIIVLHVRHGFYYISLTYFAQKQRDKKQNKQTNEKKKQEYKQKYDALATKRTYNTKSFIRKNSITLLCPFCSI